MSVNLLKKFCDSRLKRVGLIEGQKWTLWTIVLAYGFFGSIIILVSSLFTGAIVATLGSQYCCLSSLYFGLFVSLIYYQDDLRWICKECGSFPIIDVPWVEKEFEILQKIAVNSFERKYVKFQNFVVSSVAFQLLILPIFRTIVRGAPLQLPFSGSYDNTYIFILIYITEVIYGTTAALSCTIMLDFFSMIVMHMTVHYKILQKAIIELRPGNKTEKILRQCILHHQHLINIFKKFRHIFKLVFFFIYVGLFSSSATTRAIIMTDFDPTLLGLIISETTYLSPYCMIMEFLMDANQGLRFAFYSCNWLQFSTKINKSVQIAMIRTLKDPTIAIYHDGPGVNMKSFTTLINATFTYLASAILM